MTGIKSLGAEVLTGPEQSSDRTEIFGRNEKFFTKKLDREKFAEKFSWNLTSSLISRLTSTFAIGSY